jgi:pilus assembly protein Flp/PilA
MMLDSVAWAARVRAEQAARTPEQQAQDVLDFADWLGALPKGLPVPLQPGQVLVIFNRGRKGGGTNMQEHGQGLVEYALILVMVAVVVIVILALLGPAVGNLFSDIVRQL